MAIDHQGEKSSVDIEGGPHLCFSDDDEDQSWHSPFNSNYNGSPYDEIDELCRDSCVSDCSFEVDLECGASEIEENLENDDEKDCRICHLSLESKESGAAIVLGCSCKGELGAAHKQCAETWFKIKGNKTCEICGSTARNVVTAGEIELAEHSNEANTTIVVPLASTETRSFWQGHRFLNFLLACMIFAFVISWLFHFNVPS